MELTCPSCGLVDEPTRGPSGVHIGAYCSACGAWIKWLPQSEPRFYFGKYKDVNIKDCEDLQYLRWFKDNVKKKTPTLMAAVNDRISELEYKLK